MTKKRGLKGPGYYWYKSETDEPYIVQVAEINDKYAILDTNGQRFKVYLDEDAQFNGPINCPEFL